MHIQATTVRPVSGHVERRRRRRGDQWYMRYRLPDGRQVQRRLGPAWSGNGRPPQGSFTKRTAEAKLREVLADAYERIFALGRAWRLLGERGEPEIEAVDLAQVLAGLESSKITFASAGGGKSGGLEIAGAPVYRDAMSDSTIRERARPEPPRRKLRLSAFLAAPGIVVEGEWIKRREVIQYVANKLGGAHFDATRKRDEVAFGLLDRAIDVFRVGERRVVYFELLSIGQALTASSDVERLRTLIGDALRDESSPS